MAEQTVFSEMWKAYRGVILHSIVTSFGLDFIVQDQHGGDVDTIHSVRETGQYKNARNAAAYEARGEYDRVAYHHNEPTIAPFVLQETVMHSLMTHTSRAIGFITEKPPALAQIGRQTSIT